jgi:SH3 domain protein
VTVRGFLTGLAMLLVVTPGLRAETVFVTDELRLRLQAEPTDTSAVVANLGSGDRLELVDRAGFYSLVKTADGKEGWAKTAYLITEKPARAQLLELQAEFTALQDSVGPDKLELASVQEQLQATGQKLEQSQVEASARAARLEQLEQENVDYRQQLGIGEWKMPWRWAALGIGFSLLAGIALGMLWFDSRSRKRHGGFRIY